MTSLRIGCLGWGSLLWDPRTLPMAGAFRSDGPTLPIEFSRVSLDGRVTLVVDPTAAHVQTYWVPLAVDSIEDAIEALAVREKIARTRWSDWVGLQAGPNGARQGGVVDSAVRARIEDWLGESKLDAIVWTALPARAPDGTDRRPDCKELIAHLKSLEGAALARAEEYIRRAPRSLRTVHRARFEAVLGLHPEAAGRQD